MKLSIKLTSEDLIRALRWDSSSIAEALKERRRAKRGTPYAVDPLLRKRMRRRRDAFRLGESL